MNVALHPDRTRLERFARLVREGKRREAITLQSQRGWYDDDGVRQGGLIAFVRYYWHILEPKTPLVEGWPLWAICEHLEAITFADIARLLINVPPGFMKSLLTNVFWPAWEWGPMNMPHLRYVTFSYAAHLTERDNGRFRDLVGSREYQALWKERFRLTEIGKIKVANDATGWKLATSIGGVGTGERGDRVLLDDPHNVKEAESDQVRGETVRWFQESMENRLNDLMKSAIVVDMQRLHEGDVSGAILSEEVPAGQLAFCHLMIPMEYDAQRYPADYDGNTLGWIDPREDDGELAWSERFPTEGLAKFKKRAFMWSGQYQQLPTPRGGGIIKAASWQVWPADSYPPCELVLGSLDTAYTEKEENDASALTIWGVFRDNGGFPKAMLLYAWEGRLEIHDLVTLVSVLCSIDQRSDTDLMHATELYNRGDIQVDQIARMPVDRLLIESKASGISVGQELKRLYGGTGNFAIELIDPKQWGDKVARLQAIEPMFADEMIYAPVDRAWADRVVDNVALAPKTTKWDTPDSVSMGLRYLRQTGALLKRDEQARETTEEGMHRSALQPLY